MDITAIAVVANNGVIGDGKDQPFKIKQDWARFKRLTMGHPLIMGRKTFDAIGLLPGRTSIIVSRTPTKVEVPSHEAPTAAFVVGSVPEALALGRRISLDAGLNRVYVIGGGHIYAAALDCCDVLEITRVHADAAGDVYFPSIDERKWEQAEFEMHTTDELAFDFVTYRRSQTTPQNPGACG